MYSHVLRAFILFQHILDVLSVFQNKPSRPCLSDFAFLKFTCGILLLCIFKDRIWWLHVISQQRRRNSKSPDPTVSCVVNWLLWKSCDPTLAVEIKSQSQSQLSSEWKRGWLRCFRHLIRMNHDGCLHFEGLPGFPWGRAGAYRRHFTHDITWVPERLGNYCWDWEACNSLQPPTTHSCMRKWWIDGNNANEVSFFSLPSCQDVDSNVVGIILWALLSRETRD